MKKILLFTLALAGSAMNVQAQWVEQNPGITAGHYVNYLSIPSANVVWGTTVDGSVATPVSTRRWVMSMDGGTTFTTGLVTGATTAYEASSITSINKDTAWISMYNTNGGGRIYRTNNAGASWSNQTTATFTAPNGFPNMVHFWDANTGFTMGDPNGGYFEIYTTVNGGTNWLRVPTGNIPVPVGGEYGYTDAYDVVGDTIWFATNMGRVYKSVDKGINWTVSATSFVDIGEVQFTNGMNGIVRESAGQGMQFTTDGGTTWNDLNYTGTVFSFDMVKVQGSTGLYVSTGEDPANPGTFGSSYSYDNGVTWNILDANTHISVDFLDVNTGWSGGISAGATGGIYKWTETSVGIPVLANVNDLNIYPNPGNGLFTINFPAASSNNLISVYDAKGTLVLEKQQNGIIQSIDLSSQSRGIYFVKIQTVNDVQTKKVIIK